MRIDQTLHGYYKGHGLLATSTNSLTSDDLSKMSVLSDWTGYHVTDGGEDAYITVYPISNGRYVFAKTWYASEMKRPGCVWTHSFIIDLKNIDKAFDFRQLYNYFERPKNYDVNNYTKTLDITFEENFDSSDVFKSFDDVYIMFLYLYLVQCNNNLRILIESKESNYISLILLLLQYVPVDILYKMSICTGAKNVIKYNNKNFTLQFVDNQIGLSLKKYGLTEKLKTSDFDESIQYFVDCAKDPNDELPSLIKTFRTDISDKTDKLYALLILMKSLDYKLHNKQTKISFNEIVKILYTFFPQNNEGELLKSSFLGIEISSLFDTEPNILFAFSNCSSLVSFSNEMHSLEIRLENLENSSHEAFVGLFERVCSLSSYNNFAQLILSKGIEDLNIIEVNRIFERNWLTISNYLFCNTEFLNSGKWMLLNSAMFQKFINSFNNFAEFKHFNYWNELIRKILHESIQIKSLIAEIIVANTPNAVSIILNELNSLDIDICDTFYNYCFIDVNKVLEWLTKQSILSLKTINVFLIYIEPSSDVVKKYNNNIWRAFIKADNGNMSQEYYAFLYTLLFNRYDDTSNILIEHSYPHIYYYLETNSLSYELWKKIEVYTAKLSKIKEWDKCKKLRKGLVKYLKSNKCDKQYIINLNIEDKLKNDILKYWR